MLYDYDGSGKEHEIIASAHTLMVYEQQFKRGMIEDVFSKVRIDEDDFDDDGTMLVADYTIDHWDKYVKALWAMLKAASDLARAEGREYEKVPSFDEWSVRVTNLDMQELSLVVVTECQRGFFRTGAVATEEDVDETGEA